MTRKLVREHGITVVHSPTPVSPRQPSALFDVGAPVVIGPMNGGMTFPGAFEYLQQASARSVHTLARAASDIANLLLPGKRRAAALLVANERTEAALPSVARHVPVYRLVENGVDLERFALRGARNPERGRVRFAFVGRLVDWKGVDLLLDALAHSEGLPRIELEVFGAGPQEASLRAQAERLDLGDRVRFHGFVPQEETARRLASLDGLVLPSLYECGGAVVLEAMALGLPVIATRWGGPADYLDSASGILIEPLSRAHVVLGLTRAMARLALDPALRRRMGAAGRRKVEREYDWERKLDRMLEIYRSVQLAPGQAAEVELPLAVPARDSWAA
jgi:glycosyltransferase involved in cell wall biosynthesis